MENWSGKNVKGYQLLERIGAGGFGAVYKAHQSTVGREVAMKVILPHYANHPDFIRRFESEAQLVARLEHLHIVPLFDYWRDPEGAYLIMRWLRGGSLRDALQNKPFELEAIALLLDQIASALSIAHRNNVIHRDLKPGNILLDEDGNAYLADFGIAKDVTKPGITEIDAIVGSPDYLAPEQASGESVTPCTDIYSLGVVLYEMLTGEHPFPNLNSVELLYKHLSEPLPAITTLSDEVIDNVNAVIQKATAKNPAHRYSDAMELATAFRQAIKLRPTENVVETLTQREQEILSRIVNGLSNQQIANDLVITVGTVKWYVNQIFRKLNVRSRVQAIVRARELNLIVSDNGYPTQIPSVPTEDFNPQNPYKGLQAFQVADNQDFFGREKLTQKLISRIAENGEYARFLAVVGPSGSGKSSLVKAGVVPALWRGDVTDSEKWFIVEMLPGSHPLDELEVALTRVAAKPATNLREQLERDERGLLRASQMILPDDKSEIVLIIDQFEEVFTMVEDEAVRQHFLQLLLGAVTDSRSRIRVIITLRADFYDRPLQYPDFGELIRTRTETVLPLGAEGLERAILKPAERVGAVFESGLVATIVGDVHYQPGALPLLQYALTELFERRQGRKLTRETYREIGGAIGALAKHADDIYKELRIEAQHLARQMFLRLVTLGEGTEDTRRRTPRSELLALTTDSDLMDEVIDTYAAYRLLSLDHDPVTRSPMVEVAHEAILREWERLRLWINDSREEIRMQQQLALITEEWLNANKDVSFLANGLRLEQFEQWVKNTSQALTPDEHAYIEASLNERTRQIETEAERQHRESQLEQRSQTFLRGLVAVLLIAMVIALGLTGVAVTQSNAAQIERDTAQLERERAEQQSRIAQTRELVGYANSTLETDAELSVLLALQAVSTTYAIDGTILPEANTVLHQAVQRLNPPRRLSAGEWPSGAYSPLVLNADGTHVVYSTETAFDGRVGETAIVDVRTGEVISTLIGNVDALTTAYSDRIITWVDLPESITLIYWDISIPESPQQLNSFRLDRPDLPRVDIVNRLEWLDLTLDFKYLMVLVRGENRFFDVTTGEEITDRVHIPTGKGFTQFSHNGQYMGNINPDKTVSIIETSTWTEIARLSPAGTSIKYFTFAPDANAILSTNANNTVTVWDIETFEELYTVAPGIPPQRLTLSRDGSRLAVYSLNGQVVIWDTLAQAESMRLSVGGQGGAIMFDNDASRLVVLYNNERLQIWDLIPGREHLTFVSTDVVPDGGVSLGYSHDGTKLLTGTVEGTINIWDATSGQNLLQLGGHAPRSGAVWNPDSSLIASWEDDLTALVRLWDATTGENIMTLSGHTNNIYAANFSPDGTKLASSGYDETVRVWDVSSGDVILTLEQPISSKGVAWSPDGQRIVASTDIVGGNGYVRVWDADSGELQLDIPLGNSRTGTVMFSPDGKQIVVGMQEAHKAYVIDAQTGDILLTLSGHASNVPGIAYSPDGMVIATASHDGSTRLWDSHTGQELLTLFTPGSNRVSFSPDGKYLATQNLDGTTRIYVLAIDELKGIAQSRLTRWWTQDECQRYLHTSTCPITG